MSVKLTRIAVLLSIGLLMLALTACNIVTGSGPVVTREFDLRDFDSVDLGNAFAGTITQGSDFKVEVRINENLEQYLAVEQNGSTIRIALDPGTAVANATLEVDITTPTLVRVDASGASRAALSGFDSAAPFRGEASGGSRIEGSIATGALTLNASGASHITLSGAGQDLVVDASGASTVDLTNFQTASADVTASGSSTVTVNTSGRLDGDISGGSTLNYVGSPQLGSIDQSGGSSINQR